MFTALHSADKLSNERQISDNYQDLLLIREFILRMKGRKNEIGNGEIFEGVVNLEAGTYPASNVSQISPQFC